MKIEINLDDEELDAVISALEEKEVYTADDDIFLAGIISKFERAIKGDENDIS